MNFLVTVFFTIVVAVLQTVAAQQSTGLKLCLNYPGDNWCKISENPITISDLSDPLIVLRNGFSNCFNMVMAAENRSMIGFSQAIKLVSSEPRAALQVILETIKESTKMFFEAGPDMFFSMGKAMSLSNGKARQGLTESTLKLQVVALHVLDEMRTSSNLGIQGVNVGDDAAIQAIEALRQKIQVAFSPMYAQIVNSYQKAKDAVTYAQRNPMTPKISNRKVVNEVKDRDARAAISAIREAAADAIRRGSTASRVNQSSEALISIISELAEDAPFVRDQAVIIQQLTRCDDQSSEENSFLKGFEAINSKIQRMFISICLEFGSASPNLTVQQVGKPIIAVEHGDDEVTYALELAEEMVRSALQQEGNARKSLLDAAEQTAKYGYNALYQRIVEGVQGFLNFL